LLDPDRVSPHAIDTRDVGSTDLGEVVAHSLERGLERAPAEARPPSAGEIFGDVRDAEACIGGARGLSRKERGE
jgi:hypothetical protein